MSTRTSAPRPEGREAPKTYPVLVRAVRDRPPQEVGQVHRQRCGGGYRVVRKKIGNS